MEFKRDVSTSLPVGAVISSPLGDSNSTKLVQADVNKAVKFQAGASGLAGTFEAVLCGAGETIDAFVSSVEPNTVNEGFSFGGVQVQGQALAEVGTTTVAIDDMVEIESQAALGTAGVPQVVKRAAVVVDDTTKESVAVDVIALFESERKVTNWRCTQILTGDGTTQGDSILLERVL